MFGPDIDLMPDEKMVLASNPHWFYFWKQVAAGVGLLLLLLLLWTVDADWAIPPSAGSRSSRSSC